jgi:NAD(P)-dependent dehydrogenase (short-subunit alcohol dehydrogenase family)/acyl carrier protein
MWSTVTGGWVAGQDLTASYWCENLRHPVRFADAIAGLAAAGYTRFIEVSPHPVLTTAIAETAEAAGVPVAVTGTLRRGEGGWQRLLASAAEWWTTGGELDFATLFPGGRPACLPTYAFHHQRYWLARGNSQVRPDAGPADDWRYQVAWVPVPAPAATAAPGTWLIVVPAGREVADVVAALGLGDERVLEVSWPGRPAIAAELAAGQEPGRVLSLLALDDRPHPLYPGLTVGFAQTALLIQALADARIEAQVWLATQGAVAVDDTEDVPNPMQAAVWGLGAVLALDQPTSWGGLIDLPARIDRRSGTWLTAMLSGQGEEDQLALRTAGVFARRLVRGAGRDQGTAGWQPRGTILITGGTGALGARTARWLARRGAGHLVLASRRGPHAAGVTELIRDLAADGVQATAVECDFSDRAAVAGLLASLPDLSAVVHAAGVVHGETALTDSTIAELAELAAGKVMGAWHLHELCGDLDAFILFSSGAGVWGNSGQAGYAAANAALDALARHRRHRGLAATAIAWGALSGGGMVDELVAAQLERRGVVAMDPDLALSVLADATGSPSPSLVVARFDWERFVPLYTASRRRPLLRDLPEARRLMSVSALPAPEVTQAGGLASQLLALPPEARSQLVRKTVKAHAAAALGLPGPDAIGAGSSFKDLGFDSLTGVDLRNRLNGVTGLQLPAALVFDYPTPAALAAYLCDLLAPGGEVTPDALLRDLDRLEAALAGPAAEPGVRRQVSARLRTLLRRFDEPDSAGQPASLDSASDEEMFELIDRELGLS